MNGGGQERNLELLVMGLPDVTLAILDDGPFRGGTFMVRPGQTLTFATSWLNPHRVVYRPTGEIVETVEGEAAVFRCENISGSCGLTIDDRDLSDGQNMGVRKPPGVAPTADLDLRFSRSGKPRPV